jgi:hypothetical protein
LSTEHGGVRKVAEQPINSETEDARPTRHGQVTPVFTRPHDQVALVTDLPTSIPSRL